MEGHLSISYCIDTNRTYICTDLSTTGVLFMRTSAEERKFLLFKVSEGYQIISCSQKKTKCIISTQS